MLEALVSSRIRRSLLEHLLTHPNDRFYLRGLAKELLLPVSPLRRELKRLEHAGMLRAEQEGNILFYIINTASQPFLQLRQAGQGTPALYAQELPPEGGSAAKPSEAGTAQRLGGTVSTPRLMPVGVISGHRPPAWRGPLRSVPLMTAAAAGMALVLLVTSAAYLTMTSRRLASKISRLFRIDRVTVEVAAPQTSSSGTMRGNRWQIVPGGFGGFSSGRSNQ